MAGGVGTGHTNRGGEWGQIHSFLVGMGKRGHRLGAFTVQTVFYKTVQNSRAMTEIDGPNDEDCTP